MMMIPASSDKKILNDNGGDSFEEQCKHAFFYLY